MRKFLSKFKFKWWSWEIDTLKLLPFAFLVLAFLPILPYEKKDGKLISFLGTEAANSNFYDLFLTKTSSFIAQIKDYDGDYAKKYYLNKGFSDNKASCLVVRDLIINQANFENKMNNSLNKDTFSPVPVIWLTRLIGRDFVSGNLAKIEISEGNFIKNCGEEILPPGFFNNEFNYQISK